MSEKELILEQIDEEIFAEDEQYEVEFDEKKEAERLKKAEALWIDVQKGNTKHLITKVAAVLNRYPETRNSDIALMVKFWEVYEGFKGDTININQLFSLERLTSIARSRAKIQNEYRLFLADEKVKRFRKSNEETEKEYQMATKPAMDAISIYADESGKNDDFAIVGSIWILANEGALNSEIVSWTSKRKEVDATCPHEFHFHKINNNGNNLQVYKDFIDFVVERGHMTSYRCIAVNKTKINKPIDEVITELFYQLVRTGVEYEKNTGRVTLPKQVVYFKDAEEGESALRVKKIQQSLIDNFKIHYDDKLKLNTFQSLDSKLNRFIQIADLYTGAINRRVNHLRKNPNSCNAKDEFSDYVCSLLGVEEIIHETDYVSEFSGGETSDLATLYLFD